MNREQLLVDLLALLAPLAAPFTPEGATKAQTIAAVERMPDKLNLERFQHPRAAVWAGYHSGRFERSDATSAMTQRGRLRFDVAILTRKLDGPAGSLAMLDAVEELLAGARLASGGSPLELESEEYSANSNGVWVYGMVFASEFPRISVDRPITSEPTLGPAFRYARQVDEIFGDTEVGTPAPEEEEEEEP